MNPNTTLNFTAGGSNSIFHTSMNTYNSTASSTADNTATSSIASGNVASNTAELPTRIDVPSIPYPPSATPSPRPPHQKAMLYLSPYTIFLATVVVVLVFTRIIQICQIKRIRRRQQREAEARWNGILSGSNLLYNGVTINLPRGGGSVPISLDTEDRIKLYKRTFEQSKLNHTLTKEDFEEPNKSDYNDDDIEETNNNNDNNENDDKKDEESQDYYYDDDEAPSLYLDLDNNNNTTTEIDSNSPTKTEIEIDNDNSQKQQEQQEKPPATTNDNNDNGNNDDDDDNDDSNDSSITIRTKIPGTCIICFEHFQVGDTIVKSEHTDSCHHVFHEDCMVRFLASNSERNKPTYTLDDTTGRNETSYSDNPCPTCRHPFCTVTQDEIVLAVLLKSMRFALLQNRENNNNESNENNNDNNNNNNNNNNEDNENDVENPALTVIPDVSSEYIANADVTLRISNDDDDESHPMESVDEEEAQNS